MNKLATTLAGLALVAGASVAPAFAQGAFDNIGLPVFVFTFAPAGGFSAINQTVNYNPVAGGLGTQGTGLLTLTSSTGSASSLIFSNTTLSFSQGGTTLFTDTVPTTTIVPLGNGNFSIASVNGTASGDQYNLTAAPVPEASTVISFGALLALGGLAVLRRKSLAKNAA